MRIAHGARTAKALRRASGPQTLAKSLQVLSELVHSPQSLTATELASRVGLHQSSVSRILSTLQAVGFVRKPDYHHFAADLGLLVFASEAVHHYPLIGRALPVFRRLVQECEPMGMTLGTLWRQRYISLLQSGAQGEVDVLPCNAIVLHLAVAGLRQILELPEWEALDCLQQSLATQDWARLTNNVPEDPVNLLNLARQRLTGDVLVLFDWAGPDEIKTAMPVRLNGQVVATFALYDRKKSHKIEDVFARLRYCVGEIEEALAKGKRQ